MNNMIVITITGIVSKDSKRKFNMPVRQLYLI